MTTPVSFDATTARHALAMLVPGQAQKELSVNETFARIDALLHPAVEGEATTPPQDPVAGECWIVAQPASGAWQGHEGELACWDGTQWTLCTPIDGMQVFDRSESSRIVYEGGWNRVERPTSPSGGAVVDVEARAAIEAIIDIFATLSIFPRT